MSRFLHLLPLLILLAVLPSLRALLDDTYLSLDRCHLPPPGTANAMWSVSQGPPSKGNFDGVTLIYRPETKGAVRRPALILG